MRLSFSSCVFAGAVALGGQTIRPGLFAAADVRALPLRTSGYQVYMIGEAHGIDNNVDFQMQYLRLVYAHGVRDVALEEDAVYENDAQEFTDGRAREFSPHLCLRAPMLRAIHDFNAPLRQTDRVRVHLIDIDSPAAAIRRHLDMVKARLQATRVTIPTDADIARRGLDIVSQLTSLATNAADRSALRTIGFSIQALRDGLEVDTGPTKGSPYLESREQAVASNIVDIAKDSPILVVYGSDHVSRTLRHDAGPNRDRPLKPVAQRLEAAGLKVYTVITQPLGGASRWRGQTGELMWTAADGHLATGETMDAVLKAAPGAHFIYVDPRTERTAVPSDDIGRMAPDAFVLFGRATPMPDSCGGGNASR